jgi:hypothetical protein
MGKKPQMLRLKVCYPITTTTFLLNSLQKVSGYSRGSLKSPRSSLGEVRVKSLHVPCSLTMVIAHDNGYTTTLTQLQTEGLLSKIILLRGYAEIARELQNLDLPVADIENVFMKQKITTHPFGLKKGATTHSTPNIKGTADFDRFRTTSQAGSVGIGSPIKANKGLIAADISNKGQKRLDPRVVSLEIVVVLS